MEYSLFSYFLQAKHIEESAKKSFTQIYRQEEWVRCSFAKALVQRMSSIEIWQGYILLYKNRSVFSQRFVRYDFTFPMSLNFLCIFWDVCLLHL